MYQKKIFSCAAATPRGCALPRNDDTTPAASSSAYSVELRTECVGHPTRKPSLCNQRRLQAASQQLKQHADSAQADISCSAAGPHPASARLNASAGLGMAPDWLHSLRGGYQLARPSRPHECTASCARPRLTNSHPSKPPGPNPPTVHHCCVEQWPLRLQLRSQPHQIVGGHAQRKWLQPACETPPTVRSTFVRSPGHALPCQMSRTPWQHRGRATRCTSPHQPSQPSPAAMGWNVSRGADAQLASTRHTKGGLGPRGVRQWVLVHDD